MYKLIILNLILIALITAGLWITKRYVKGEKAQNILLFAAAVFTILFHYSSFIFKLLTGTGAMEYLSQNPNLLLPIYPCNIVMWSALIFSLLKNKRTKFGAFISDYMFWFGIVSTLVGMFANVDFIKTPTLADYEILKSVIAHATLLFNVLLLLVFGYIRTDVKRNITSIVISVFVMAAIGGYCNLIIGALASADMAYYVNSMFMLHSPFEDIAFLTYPIIALIAVPLYLAVFVICDRCARLYKRTKSNSSKVFSD